MTRTSVKQRVAKLKGTVDPVEAVMSELRKLRDSSRFLSLSDSTLAQRMAIGTQTGKYHNRTCRTWGVSTGDFTLYRDEYVQDGQYLQYYHNDDLSSDLKNRIMQGLEVVKSKDLVDTFSTFLQQQISQTRKYQPDEWITLLPKYSKVNLHTLNRFYQETTGESPDMDRINLSQVLLYLGLHSKLSNYEFMQNYNSGKHLDINSVNQDLNYAIISIVNHTVRQTFQNVIDNVVKVATDKYLEQHQLIHSEMPELFKSIGM